MEFVVRLGLLLLFSFVVVCGEDLVSLTEQQLLKSQLWRGNAARIFIIGQGELFKVEYHVRGTSLQHRSHPC